MRSLPVSYASWLESILHGRDAQSLPDVTLLCLPLWSIRPARISVGRKGIAEDGSVANLPVRIDWEDGSVIESGVARSLNGRLRGIGWDEAFVAELSDTGEITGLPDGASSTLTEQSRRKIIARGSTARWEMGMALERLLRKRMQELNLSVGAELGGSARGALDSVTLEQVITDMHLGRDGEERSVIHRAIDKCLEPDTFDRVEVSRYLSVRMRSRSIERIRDALGDPRIGFKVRSVYRETEPSSLDELIATYRQRYPSDRLGRKVAIAALSTGVALDATTDSLQDENDPLSRYALTEGGDFVAVK